MEKIYIYKTSNKINGKIYVGQHQFASLLKDDVYLGSGKLIKLAIKKYGKENFSKEIITIAMSPSEADVLEKYYIEKYDATNPKIGYNLMLGGQSSRGSFTKETLERMSLAKRGKPSPKRGCHLSEETRKRISEAQKDKTKKGHPWTTEMREKLEGRKRSAEARKRMSDSHKGKDPWNKGKHIQGHKHSEESKKKIAESQKGKHPSEETLKKLSESHKGKHWKLVDGKRVYC